MSQVELTERCVELLLDDMPEYRAQATLVPTDDEVARRRLLRSLMNVRVPGRPLPDAYWRAQDELLSAERAERGVVDAMALPTVPGDERLALWQGDITRLGADAIVNAANCALLGCFIPCHGCIDNAIHSASGLQLRDACAELMRAQGHEEPTGEAKITPGFNLPARFVIHTVGPIVSGLLTMRHRRALASCYRSCLELAEDEGLTSVAFCCISTGEFRFPAREAARIAVDTVRATLDARPDGSVTRVIFNVFKDEDLAIYRKLLYREW